MKAELKGNINHCSGGQNSKARARVRALVAIASAALRARQSAAGLVEFFKNPPQNPEHPAISRVKNDFGA